MSLIGLGIGFALYAGASRLAEPWQSAAIGGCFAVLGVAAWIYAAGERWIQVLAAVLVLWGIARAFFVHG